MRWLLSFGHWNVGIAFLLSIASLILIETWILQRLRGRLLETAQWISMAFWSVVALGFGGLVAIGTSGEIAMQYYSGLMVESLLSVDNLILAAAVLSGLGQRSARGRSILMYGVLAALFIRGTFFFAASHLLIELSWIPSGIAAIMIVAGLRGVVGSVDQADMPQANEKDFEEGTQSRFTRVLISFVRRRGVLAPVVLVICLELLNSLMSVDSMSALLSTSDKPFVLFSASIFGTILLRVSASSAGRLLARFPHVRTVAAGAMALAGFKMLLPSLVSTPVFLALCLVLVVSGKHLAMMVRALREPVFPEVCEDTCSRF